MMQQEERGQQWKNLGHPERSKITFWHIKALIYIGSSQPKLVSELCHNLVTEI